MPKRSHLVCIRLYRCREPLPIIRFQIRYLQHLEGRLLVALAQQWLHLEQWPSDVEFDGRVGSLQADVREERAKPGVGLNDPFKIVITLCSGDIGYTPREQRPTRGRARQIAAPDLNDTRQTALHQKGWCERTEIFGCNFLKTLPEPRILSAA